MLEMKYWGTIVDFYVAWIRISQLYIKYLHLFISMIFFEFLCDLVTKVMDSIHLAKYVAYCFPDKGKHTNWAGMHSTYLKLQVET